jgi:transcriptional regulator with PAS, ATPase and Fis domain
MVAPWSGDPMVELRSVLRVLAACPTPTLVISADGRLRGGSPAALQQLGLSPEVPLPVREVLGLGWRELELVASEGRADLLADLPRTRPGVPRLGWRLRPERVADAGGRVAAVVVYLDPPSLGASGMAGRVGRAPAVGFDALFGVDPAVRAAKLAAERFAATRLPLLLLAETGTGKDLLARAIHAASPRRDRPFVAINCGALSPQLLESELFGYAPGAFTDASREGQEGKIGAARGGTLFLDEVAEMPAPLQALLLRVLEDGTYYRVGENVPRQADVRLVCATCRDLPRMVEQGAFRQDLFFRIAGACLTLPPVRERSDVPALVEHVFATLIERELAPDQVAPRLSAEAAAWLAAQAWPGNIRQLKTALHYALVLADGQREIRREHLPALVLGGWRPATQSPGGQSPVAAGAASSVPSHGGIGGGSGPLGFDEVATTQGAVGGSLALAQRQLITQTVEACQGNLAAAARRLGVARSTLYRHLRRQGANEPEGTVRGRR